MKILSELEGVSLGIIFNFQPCTAYLVRSKLRASPSSLWQASAGSVYPLISRLEKQGLLQANEDGDKRGRKYLTVTEDGVAAMQSWIMSGSDHQTITAIMDPLRNRISFLQLLETDQRLVYLDELLLLMTGFHEETKARLLACSKTDDLYQHMVALGAMQSTQSRLQWLHDVKKLLLEDAQ